MKERVHRLEIKLGARERRPIVAFVHADSEGTERTVGDTTSPAVVPQGLTAPEFESWADARGFSPVVIRFVDNDTPPNRD